MSNGCTAENRLLTLAEALTAALRSIQPIREVETAPFGPARCSAPRQFGDGRRWRPRVMSCANRGALPSGGIYESNRYVLIGLLRRLGCGVTDLGILRDDRAAVALVLREAAANHDALVTSGGVSVGTAGLVRDVIAELGRIEFWRLAVKPGKPVTFGRIGACLALGLWDYPVKTISMLEFRQDAEQVVRQIQAGERLILTYRGKPVAHLEPMEETTVDVTDPFYSLDRLADAEGKSLSNREMDDILYAR